MSGKTQGNDSSIFCLPHCWQFLEWPSAGLTGAGSWRGHGSNISIARALGCIETQLPQRCSFYRGTVLLMTARSLIPPYPPHTLGHTGCIYRVVSEQSRMQDQPIPWPPTLSFLFATGSHYSAWIDLQRQILLPQSLGCLSVLVLSFSYNTIPLVQGLFQDLKPHLILFETHILHTRREMQWTAKIQALYLS